jgi:hypothetical protein
MEEVKAAEAIVGRCQELNVVGVDPAGVAGWRLEMDERGHVTNLLLGVTKG